MIELYYNGKDPRYIFLFHDNQTVKTKQFNRRTRKYEEKDIPEILALEAHLNKIPDYQFLPSFTGIPHPVCFLEKQKFGERVVYYCFSGLWKEIKDWCREKGIVCNGIYNITDFNNPDKQVDKYICCTDYRESLEDFKNYIMGWELSLDLRDYQFEAIWKILHYKQSMSELATRAGKTLIAYCIFRHMLERGGAHNILMVVPSIQLVKQGVNDMNEYKEFFSTEAIWAEGEYCEGSNLTIGTFQSLVKRCCKGTRGAVNKHYNPKFFDKFDVICIDECHKADCESIKQIMSQPFIKNAKLIFGFSGTLPEKGSMESYSCQAMLGPCIQDIETMELVNSGYLAKPIIHQIRLQYDENKLTDSYIRYGEYLCANYVTENGKKILLPKEERDMTMIHKKELPIVLREARKKMQDGKLAKNQYCDMLIDMCKASGSNLLVLEQMLAEHSQKKLDLIYDLLFSKSSNGIVFAHNEAYVDFLQEKIQARFPGRNVYKIKGSTSNTKRQKIIEAMNTNDKDAILIASFGTVSTGLTFKNIDYAIFAQSFKSPIIVLQSLGRGLLKTLEKTEFHLYDIIDVFPTERLKKQGESKTKLYKEKGFEYNIVRK